MLAALSGAELAILREQIGTETSPTEVLQLVEALRMRPQPWAKLRDATQPIASFFAIDYVRTMYKGGTLDDLLSDLGPGFNTLEGPCACIMGFAGTSLAVVNNGPKRTTLLPYEEYQDPTRLLLWDPPHI